MGECVERVLGGRVGEGRLVDMRGWVERLWYVGLIQCAHKVCY